MQNAGGGHAWGHARHAADKRQANNEPALSRHEGGSLAYGTGQAAEGSREGRSCSEFAEAWPEITNSAAAAQRWHLPLSGAICHSAWLKEFGRHVGGAPLELDLLPVVAAGVQESGAGGGDLFGGGR